MQRRCKNELYNRCYRQYWVWSDSRDDSENVIFSAFGLPRSQPRILKKIFSCINFTGISVISKLETWAETFFRNSNFHSFALLMPRFNNFPSLLEMTKNTIWNVLGNIHETKMITNTKYAEYRHAWSLSWNCLSKSLQIYASSFFRHKQTFLVNRYSAHRIFKVKN